MGSEFRTNPDSAIHAGNKRTSALSAYELFPLSPESDPGPHAYSLSCLDVPSGESCIRLHCLSGESEEYVNPFLRDLAHVIVALLTSQGSANRGFESRAVYNMSFHYSRYSEG